MRALAAAIYFLALVMLGGSAWAADFNGVWRQIGSNAGQCPSCQITISGSGPERRAYFVAFGYLGEVAFDAAYTLRSFVGFVEAIWQGHHRPKRSNGSECSRPRSRVQHKGAGITT